MRDRDDSTVDLNFPEEAGVLFGERFATAFEITDDLFELFAGEIAKWLSARDQLKRIIHLDRRERSHPDDMLCDDVVRFLLNANRIERPFAN